MFSGIAGITQWWNAGLITVKTRPHIPVMAGSCCDYELLSLFLAPTIASLTMLIQRFHAYGTRSLLSIRVYLASQITTEKRGESIV